MSAAVRCGTCRHWEPDHVESTIGECRRYAPRPGDVDENGDARWADTRREQWCGEWTGRRHQLRRAIDNPLTAGLGVDTRPSAQRTERRLRDRRQS